MDSTATASSMSTSIPLTTMNNCRGKNDRTSKSQPEKFSKVRFYADEISRLCDEISLIKSAMPPVLPGEEFEKTEQFLSAKQSLDEAIVGVRANTFLLYWALTEPDFLNEDGCIDEEFLPVFKKAEEVFEIKTVVDNGCIFVKLPLLWSRYLYHTKAKHYTKAGDYLSWFDRELNAAFQKIDNEIPFVSEKHFSYLFVIPQGQMTFADNDNYDTKHITDVICQHIGTTDSGLTTSFSYMSIRAGNLEEGTYIAITPSYGNPPGLNALVNQFLKQF